MSLPIAATLFALVILVRVTQGMPSLPQKTNVIKIAVVAPFYIPFNPTDLSGAATCLQSNTGSCANYLSLHWYINETNYNPNVLPTSRIEVVPLNSNGDRGISLTQTLSAISDYGVSAIIGELYSRNTVTMAVGAAVKNALHCAYIQAKSMLALLSKFNITTAGVLATNDEFGQGLVQSLQSFAPSYNITLSLVIPLDIAKIQYDQELAQAADAQIQYLLIGATSGNMLSVFISAKKLNMLDGSYLYIPSTGWGAYTLQFAGQSALLADLVGVYQVDNASPYDYNQLGASKLASDYMSFWQSLWIPNRSPQYAGLPWDFNKYTIVPYNATTAKFFVPSNCINDTTTAPFKSVPKFIFQSPSDGGYYSIQGDQCTHGGLYPIGYFPLLSLLTGYQFQQPTSFMSQMVSCGEIFVGMFDSAIKSGTPVEAINNRTFFKSGMQISKLINNANISSMYGKTYAFDNNGDMINDQSVLVYMPVNITSTLRTVSPVAIGNWSYTNDVVNLFDPTAPLIFLGNKTSPPPPRQIPVIQFAAKTSVRYAFDAIVALCSLFTLGLWGYMMVYKDLKIFKASSPRFLSVIIVGANVSYISVWLFSQFPMHDASCVTYGWLKYMGFATVFGSLLLKTYRISVIFSNKKSKSKANVKHLNDTVLFAFLLGFLALWAAILVIWTIIPSQRPKLVIDSIANVAKNGTILFFKETPHCDFGGYNSIAAMFCIIVSTNSSYVCLAAMVITLAFGVMLTYSVRNTPSAFNESKWIAMALYNWVVIGIVLNAIANFAVTDPDVIFVMEALNVMITQTGVAGFLFVPKMMEIAAGRGNEANTFTSSVSTSSHSSQVSSQVGNSAANNNASTELARQNEQLQQSLSKVEKELAELKAKFNVK
ncbi:hypothetical protein HDU76_002233 [Blyttiomyces sp. JEL0837]|nr:hypothetical protein HDU76_002233 [Blyttiomyces sp. JEL0837]